MTLAQNWWISFVSAMDGVTVATQQYYTGSVVDKAFEGTLAGYWMDECMRYEPLFETISQTLVTIVSVVVWNLPYAILFFGNFHLFDRYLLQPKRVENWTTARWIHAFKTILFNLTSVFVVHFFAAPIIHMIRPDFAKKELLWNTFPSLLQWACDMLKGVIVEDFVFYFLHRALHHPMLYARIHKMHHEYKNPFHIAAMYCSLLEFFLSDILPLTCGFLCATHWSSALGFISYRLYLTTEVHSGYSFPWSLDNIMDSLGLYFYAGSKFHDCHHAKYNCNYGSNLYFWDWFFGTGEKSLKPGMDKEL